MQWRELLKEGAEFPSGRYFRHRGVFVYRGNPPEVCPVCESNQRRYHAHGSFLRWFVTLVGRKIERVRLRKPRFKCLSCTHTFSVHPPEGLPYKRTCNFLIVVFLWSYLAGTAGMHRALPAEFSEEVSPRTVSRYLKSAKAKAVETQQFIREALMERTEPRPIEEIFFGGPHPPESLLKRQRAEPEKASTLWRALAMLLNGAKALNEDPRTLLAWANQRSQNRKRRFLL